MPEALRLAAPSHLGLHRPRRPSTTVRRVCSNPTPSRPGTYGPLGNASGGGDPRLAQEVVASLLTAREGNP